MLEAWMTSLEPCLNQSAIGLHNNRFACPPGNLSPGLAGCSQSHPLIICSAGKARRSFNQKEGHYHLANVGDIKMHEEMVMPLDYG
jgi:hypothetical protein